MSAFWLSCLTHQYDAAITKAELVKTMLVEHRSELKRVGTPKALLEQINDTLKVFTAYQQVKRKELLGVPVGIDGIGTDHGDLPGALQPLPL